MSIRDKVEATRNKIHYGLMETDPTYRQGVLDHHIQSYQNGDIDKDVVKELLGSYGYTFEGDVGSHEQWGDTITLPQHHL